MYDIIIFDMDTSYKLAPAGGGRIQYPYEGNSNEIAGILYINPLMYTFTVTAKLGPLDQDFNFIRYANIPCPINKFKL